ncbi:HAD family phosphatase [Roseomonas sp. NAR14]|uniref:HAD family phosphatase n=1 Tax=Roseomonas acroporae TaxID=2937791 RepID=A0A9X1Y2L0_9PROT|nr:HAD family phosphatase [Roseomonas acroporae]MCK8782784.1 HAD family phosphatase [Roseomonas acroporae]
MPDDDLLPPGTRGLIFDCDGTLVDTPPVYAAAWAAGFRLSGREMARDWYMRRAGLSESTLLDAFEAEHGVALDRAAVVARMRAAFLAGLGRLAEIATVTAIVRGQRGRLPMAVASGGSREIVAATLRATGLAPLFDAVVTFDDVGRAKPDPALFQEAARRLGVPPAGCVVFEDSAEGLEAARRAGMRPVDVAILRGSTPPGRG